MVDVQKEHIRQVLETAGWRVRGSGGAAVRLGSADTLETRMAKLGLSRPRASLTIAFLSTGVPFRVEGVS